MTTTRRILVGTLIATALCVQVRGQSQDSAARQQSPGQSVRPLQAAPVTQMAVSNGLDQVRGGQMPPQLQPAPLLPAPVSQLDQPKPAAAVGTNFSLQFSEPTEIRDILLLIVKDTPISVVLDPEVSGTFTGELKNVSLTQALDLVLSPIKLAYSLNDNILKVFKRQMETRVFNLDYVSNRGGYGGYGNNLYGNNLYGAGMGGYGGGGGGYVGGAGYGGGGTMAAGGYGTGMYGGMGGTTAGVGGYGGSEFFGEIQNGISHLTSGEGKLTIDRKASIIQVTDYPDRLDKIGNYIDLIMLRVNRQVNIQAQVIEVDLNKESATGINWNKVFAAAGGAVTLTQNLNATSGGAGFQMGVNIKNFSGLISAFETQGKVNVLQTPRVAAMNNEPAYFRVGTEDVFFATTSQVDATTGRLLQTSVVPQSVTEGVTLTVTSQISADGIIHMSITPTITERTGQATSRLGDTVPIVSVRDLNTLVRVHDGETIVIGGLMSERASTQRNKVPVLGDVPLVGNLFRSNTNSKRKTELIILLTPTVMTPAEIAADAAREQQNMYELQRGPNIKK